MATSVFFQLLIKLFFLTLACEAGNLLVTPNGYFNDFNINPFNGTVLERFINFRFREIGDPVSFPDGSREDAMQHHEPLIFRYFDWVIWRFRRGHLQGDPSKPPRTVLFRPTETNMTTPLLGRVPILNPDEKRVLVIAGDDVHLSVCLRRMQRDLTVRHGAKRVSVDDFLARRFSSVFFEAKDISHKFIKTVPMGFTNFYLLQIPPGLIDQQIIAARLQNLAEKKLAFAGWGKIWSYLDDKLPDRAALAQFLQQNVTQQWIRRQSLEFEDYWRLLGTYKYSLCPVGNGIQAPKLNEAFIMRVVPVVTRFEAFVDLAELGFPILIIDSWDVLTPEYLQHAYETKFLHVDWDRVLRMLTIDGVRSLLDNEGKYPF